MPDRARALAAICDTFVPGGDGLPSASEMGVPRVLRSEVEALGRPALVAELDQLLDVVELPLANVALARRAVRFSDLDAAEREAYLKRWATSPIPLKRKAFQVMKRLTLLYAFGQDGSPYAAAMGYARPQPPQAALTFLRLGTPAPGEVIDADVCVIGSGAGGSVVAAQLARAGKRVVVLERAQPRLEDAFDGRELAGYASLFLDRGIATTTDRAIALLAGNAVGGGTVVNWNTSLRLSPAVADEWRRAGVDDLAACYAAVEKRSDVGTDESERNGANAALERGSAALGLAHRTIPRNVKGCGDCGHCTLGCRRGAKQSTLRTYLTDACDAGAEILAACDARRIDVQNGRVTGVTARVSGGEVTIRASQVALAAGAIHSPAVLLRSRIATRRAGRDLHLHPVAITSGLYAEDLGGIWSGVPQSVMTDAFAEVDGAYGFRLEVPQGYPGIQAASFPWWGAAAHRERANEARRIAPFIAIVRDRVAGQVSIDRQGEPLVWYANGPLERRLLMRGMVEAARIHAAAGAKRVFTLHTPPLDVDASRIDELVAEVGRRGIVPNAITLFSAHQMSSCHIGRDRASSVADPDGQVWDARGLFVTDASAFPTASGVNPMMTVMALAMRTAQRIQRAA